MATWTNTTKNSTTFTGIIENSVSTAQGLFMGFLSYTYADTSLEVYPTTEWSNGSKNSTVFSNEIKN